MRRTLFLLLFIPLQLGAQGLVTVEFKVFPQPYSLLIQGQVQSPVRIEGTRRWYRLPSGDQTMTLTAQGSLPLRLSKLLRDGVVVQEKLLPRGGPLAREGVYTTGKRPRGLTFTPSGQVVVALGEDTGLDIISLSPTQTPASPPRRIAPPEAVFKGFSQAAIHPNQKELWVTQVTTGRVQVFTLPGLDYRTAYVTGLRGLDPLAFSLDGSQVFLGDTEGKSLVVLDGTTGGLMKTLPLEGSPRDFGVGEEGVYAALYDGASAQRISLPGLQNLGVLSYGPQGALRAAERFEDRLYLADMLRGVLLEAQAPTGRYLRYLALGPNLLDLAVDPEGRYLYVLSRGTNNPVNYTLPGPDFGRLFVVNRTDFTLRAVYWCGNQPSSLALSPDGKTIAVANALDDTVEIYRVLR